MEIPYADGTRGPRIDEIVRIEADQDLNGQLDADLVPHYDETGNVALLTGANDEIVARYEAAPFGETITARVDSVSPEVEQVRVTPEVIELEISEEHLLLEEIAGRIELSLVNGPDAGGSIAIEVSQPVQEGRMARHRLVIRVLRKNYVSSLRRPIYATASVVGFEKIFVVQAAKNRLPPDFRPERQVMTMFARGSR